jgi:hypothetical protein
MSLPTSVTLLGEIVVSLREASVMIFGARPTLLYHPSISDLETI